MANMQDRIRNLLLSGNPNQNITNYQNLQPGSNPFATQLTPEEEQGFANFAKQTQNLPSLGYDLKGLYKEASDKNLVNDILQGKNTELAGMNPTTQSFHFTDKYKTPFYDSFSKESKYATQDAPQWLENPNNQGFQLVDKQGNILVDENQQKMQEMNQPAPSQAEEMLNQIKIDQIKRLLQKGM